MPESTPSKPAEHNPAPPVTDPNPVPQPMAVAPAPAPDGGVVLPPVSAQSSDNDHMEHMPEPLTEVDAQPKPTHTKPTTTPPVSPSGLHAPVGIIVATIIGMLILCGLAIAIYITSQ